MNRYTYAGFAGLAVVAGVWLYASPERQQLKAEIANGAVIYAENCASCHGANLKGEPDWRIQNPDGTLPAPPHDKDGHTWHHADQLLFSYIKLGGAGAMGQEGVTGFNSGMPAFEATLSDSDINAVLAFIKSRWPEDIRIIQQERDMLIDG